MRWCSLKFDFGLEKLNGNGCGKLKFDVSEGEVVEVVVFVFEVVE